MYTVSVSKILLVLYMSFALDCLCREFHIQDISMAYILLFEVFDNIFGIFTIC